jgi:hypothetical protein
MFPSCSSCAARKIACRYAEHAIPNLSLEGADPHVALVQAPPEYEKARGSDVERYSLETQMGAQENFEFSVFDADGLTDGFGGLGRPEISDFDFGLSEMTFFPLTRYSIIARLRARCNGSRRKSWSVGRWTHHKCQWHQ